MYLRMESTALLMDLYELTMAQDYFRHNFDQTACFEVVVRDLPANWGFFVMAGLEEIGGYLANFRFCDTDIRFLESTGRFSADFLDYLGQLRPRVEIRALPEGTVFFPNEPVLETSGPLIDTQILETCFLNILGFSIIEATLAARVCLAAKGIPVVDFGLRRAQGPVAALRAARAAKIAGFAGTSNLLGAKLFNLPVSGTMAHSYVQVQESEEAAFRCYSDIYGANTVLLIDTYNSVEGIKKAVKVARRVYEEKKVRIAGVRIDSGDLVSLSKFARKHFREDGAEFLKILVSSGLDEYRIAELLEKGAEIDGFGIGTRFAVSHSAPDIDIVYKIIQYGERGLFKTSPDKQTRPNRKSILRTKDKVYVKDTVVPFGAAAEDLLRPFSAPEDLDAISERLKAELANLPAGVKAIISPQKYPVEFAC